MTTQLFSDTFHQPIVAMFEHGDYRKEHDTLHLLYRSACSEPCPIRDHFLLQDRIVAVRAAERRAR